jgi:hypothetical protein
MRTFAGLLLFAATLALSAPAAACFDGFSARLHETSLLRTSDGSWSIEEARRLARWAARFHALPGSAGGVHAEFSQLEICPAGVSLGGERCHLELIDEWYELDVDDLLSTIFDRVAARRAVSTTSARAATATLYTVQVAAFSRRGRAEALAGEINRQNELGELPWEPSSFYSAGGYPAIHDVAHVVRAEREGGEVFRVVVGAFVDPAEAEVYQRAIRAAGGQAAIHAEHLR